MPRTEATQQSGWRPGTSTGTLRLRARLLARIRQFFVERDVLEVDTPVLSRFGTTDPAIASLQTRLQGTSVDSALYLHTSPEFFMKRLLAAGSGPVYQLCHVFRDGEFGKRHNPEFMMLEWYRPGMDHHALMDEIDSLLTSVLDGVCDYRPARRVSYRQWFLEETGLDPWCDTVEAFRRFAEARLGPAPAGMPVDRLDPWLDLLVSLWLEPRLGDEPVFIHDYPPGQASLAQIRQQPEPVAERFELYFNGLELANGFHELTDADEQRCRFELDNEQRKRDGQPCVSADTGLLSALAHGMPASAGVALGFDRLMMAITGSTEMDAVMPFSMARV